MAKKLVKSTIPRAAYLNLSRESKKIPAMGTAEVEEADLKSPEMIFHLNRGEIVVLERTKKDKPEKAKPDEKDKPTDKVK